MIKALKVAAMAAFLGIGLFFTAQPAHAANTTCLPVTGSGQPWPYSNYVFYCGGANSSQGGNVATALKTIVNMGQASGSTTNEGGYILSHYVSSVNPNGGAQFWIFGQYSDWTNENLTGYCDQYFSSVFKLSSQEDCATAVPDIYDATTFITGTGTSARAQFTAIFANMLAPLNTSTTLSIGGATAHEAGHWLDTSPTYRTLLGTSSTFASDSTKFQTELGNDWNSFNTNFTACFSSKTGAGVFTGDQDNMSPVQYICSGTNGSGSALNSPYQAPNENVLKLAWPYFYNANPFASGGILGTASQGDILNIIITDASLNTNPTTVSYQVTSNSTTFTQMATGLANAINKAKIVTKNGDQITATSDGPTFAITSNSRNSTAYSTSITGTGNHSELFSIVGGTATDKELFAQSTSFNTAGGGWPGSASPNNFMSRTSKLACTLTLNYSLIVYGQVPGRTGSVISTWPDGQNCSNI